MLWLVDRFRFRICYCFTGGCLVCYDDLGCVCWLNFRSACCYLFVLRFLIDLLCIYLDLFALIESLGYSDSLIYLNLVECLDALYFVNR